MTIWIIEATRSVQWFAHQVPVFSRDHVRVLGDGWVSVVTLDNIVELHNLQRSLVGGYLGSKARF